MFKPGDKVKCIDADSRFHLKVNKIYTVKGIALSGRVMLIGDIHYGNAYFQRRFVLISNDSPFQEWEKKVNARI